MTHPSPFRSSLLAILLFAPGAAIAQSDATPPSDALRGPKVEDRTTPGVPSQFGEDMNPRMRADRVPFEVFLRAVRALGEDPTPAEARLTPEQLTQIQEAQADYQKANREFMLQHAEELRTLREQTGVRNNRPGGPAQRPAANPELPPEERAKLMQRLSELQEARPSSDAAHTQIFAVLTPAQQEIVRAQVDAWTDQQIEERAMQRLESLKTAQPADNSPEGTGTLHATAAKLGIEPAKLAEIRTALTAPPTDAEKGLPFGQRLMRRIDALPSSLATPPQKDALKAFLLERAEQRAKTPKDAKPPKERPQKPADSKESNPL